MTKAQARAIANKMWRIAIIKEYGERCEVCGAVAVDCHHFLNKSIYLSTEAVDAIDSIMDMTGKNLSNVILLAVQYYAEHLKNKGEE